MATDLTRRDALRLGGAVGLATFFGIKSASAQGAAPRTFPEFRKILSHAAKNSDVVCIGDDNHLDVELMDPLTVPETMADAKASGITDIFIEMHHDQQGNIDKLARGEITRKQFTDAIMAEREKLLATIELPPDMAETDRVPMAIASRKRAMRTAEMIYEAAQKGIKVHAADPQTEEEKTRMQIQFFKFLGNKEMYTEAQVAELMKKMESRFNPHDSQVASFVAENTRGKAMVFYGSLHFFKKETHNIDDQLEGMGKKTSFINLRNDVGPVEYLKQWGSRFADKYLRRPDYFYQPKTDSYEAAELGIPKLVNAPQTQAPAKKIAPPENAKKL